ncbi:MAG: glycosyltransferase family 4 protein [Natronospirillum sp.]|uniref:glycosyltransferase family 4 protein n=1 Tax=Natronospirillum sp. TaxID=2812955 RepID=UPI0025E5292C|nr:glycosyltransferase family 4 protein [Natronospirillum sp.]MCH8551565.1 glycosyltransferase family 4 protein [Natronospirillum sp.]
MNILILYKEDYPWDVRVEKLALAATEAGNTVYILSNNKKKLERTETINNIKILRIKSYYTLNEKLRSLALFPFWFNLNWAISFIHVIKKYKISKVIVRDLPLLKLATTLKKFLGYSVYYDMAEVYPEMYRSIHQYSNPGLLTKIIKSPWVSERYERNVIYKVQHTFTMIEESKFRLIERYNLDPSMVSIVSNTPPKSKYNGKQVVHSESPLNIIYVGFLTRLRGIDLLIDAIENINSSDPSIDINFDIVGEGYYKEVLENLVRKYSLHNSVRIHGWLDHNEVNRLFFESNIGALPYRPCSHWNTTIPNKIFDYMLAGLPVISTPVTTIGRIIETSNCGVVSSSTNISDISEALLKLRNPDVRQSLGSNGRNAVLDKFNWENDKSIFIDAINKKGP